MNQPAQELDILPARISCLVLSLVDRKLLVPSTAVAEVLAWEGTPEGGDNDICHGWITWREQRIPLISLEAALGAKRQALSSSYRIAVFNAIGAAANLGFFAARLDAIPQSVQMTQQSVLVAEESGQPGLLLETVVGDDRAWVPDLAAVEVQVAKLKH